MKIAIIGAGFYGIRLAVTIRKNFPNHQVVIYEKNDSPLMEAASNNQHRLHLGFHYPRCNRTITQAHSSFVPFQIEYGDCVEDIENNLYIVHRDSKVSLAKYLNVFDEFGIDYQLLNDYDSPILKNKDQFLGFVNTGEKKINLRNLSSRLLSQLKNSGVDVRLNSEVLKITEDGVVKTQNIGERFDFVINCSYSNPNLLDSGIFDTKSELCFMCLLKPKVSLDHNFAFTICDGPFSSLYPADNGNYTLSNVVKTPYYKSLDVKELYNKYSVLSQEQKGKICEEIIEESEKYFNVRDFFELENVYCAMKTKIINDVNDYRGSYCVKNGKVISVLSGKIQAAFLIEQEILEELRNV